MKTSTPSIESIKTKVATGAKVGARKAKSKAKSKRNGSALKTAARNMEGSMSGYSQQAQDFFERGKTALNAASDWVGSTAKHLPEVARKMNLPDQKAAMDFAEHRPLVVGAVGLGLGLVVGALLPRMHSAPTAITPKGRQKLK